MFNGSARKLARSLGPVLIACGFLLCDFAAVADESVFPQRPAVVPHEEQAAKARAAVAAKPPPVIDAAPYKIQPGDLLTISVWKETDLTSEVFVRPDGGLSFPLVGDIAAAGHTVAEVRAIIEQRLKKFITDPAVSVAVKQTGNRIYVVGKVNKPGEFTLSGQIDVMQAIGLAGGATPFASLNDVRIIRRQAGEEVSLRFRYHDIEKGKSLDQNILLHSGDTVVVP